MQQNSLLFLRLAFAVVLSASQNLFSLIFTPLTIYPAAFFLSLFTDTTLHGKILTAGTTPIEFIPACIAASAYLLLALLILLTKDISLKKGIAIFLLGSLLILIGNLIRIEVLIYLLLTKNINYFQQLHLLFWKILSSVYVVGIWILLTWLFHIKTIPFYSDFQTLHKRA